MTSKIAKTWADRIASGTFTHSEVRSWCSTVGPIARGRYVSKRSALTEPEAVILYTAVFDGPGIRLTDSHTTAGLDWIRRNAARRMEEGFPVEQILRDFDHFTFYGDFVDRAPVWRIHLTDGSLLDYCIIPWQSGHYDRRPEPGQWRWVWRP